MAFPPTDWGDFTPVEYEVGAPATSYSFERWFRNVVAMAQGATGAPKVMGKALDISAGSLSGTTALVDLDDAAQILLVASSSMSGNASIQRPNVEYQRSSNNGASWGAAIGVASGYYNGTPSGELMIVSGSALIDMTGYNAIRLSGQGTLSGTAIYTKGV